MAVIRRLDPVLRAYSQVLFGRSPVVGALLLLATMFAPEVGLSGLAAVVVATATAWTLRLPQLSEGLFGYNALLFGLGVGALLPGGPATWVVLALGAAATTVIAAAWRAAGTLPPLTAPFLGALWLAWLLVPLLGTPVGVEPGPDLGLPTGIAEGLRGLGALFFVPRVEVGGLVLLALVGWSRQGAVFAFVGAATAALLGLLFPIPDSLVALAGINAGLAAIALGGVWFVPSWASLALGAFGGATAWLLCLGLAPLFQRLGLPLFILPFNLAVWTLLLAMRLRTADEHPKAVDFVPGTPEQNLDFLHTRLARFGARYWVRFRLPVLGTWTITQSRGDGPTHQDAWEHALDLEVAGPDGRLHRGSGDRRQDYLCYDLPVLAVADGTVVRVIDGVADNPIGEVDLEDNWGNVVVLYHAPGLYSLVAHLKPRSIGVAEGDRVRRGDELGRCGSSGRSPRPHLHVQLQAGPEPGSPTLPMELHDVVEQTGSGPVLRAAWSPSTGSRLQNLAGAELDLGWVPGRSFHLEVDGRSVALTPEIDLYGTRVLLDEDGGKLSYGISDDLLTVYDVQAPRRSVLHAIAAALPRLPLDEDTPDLVWRDHLSPRTTLPLGLRWLWDGMAPFVPWRGLEVRYHRVREGSDRVILGESDAVQTRARIRPGEGLVEVVRTVNGSTLSGSRAAADRKDEKKENVAK